MAEPDTADQQYKSALVVAWQWGWVHPLQLCTIVASHFFWADVNMCSIHPETVPGHGCLLQPGRLM
jgi:hypothetical protein